MSPDLTDWAPIAAPEGWKVVVAMVIAKGTSAVGPGADGPSGPVIELRGLTKYYGRHRGIEGVDLSIGRGEVFGFLGPNGSGKTTTIRTMLDLIRRTGGECRVLGLDSEAGSKEIRRRTGYLPGEYGLYETLTVEVFLGFLLDLRDARRFEGRMRELADMFELDLGRRIRELSKGNRQKVGLVQAFMHDPELVILDEPTSGLDPIMQQRFYALARSECARGRTVFMSSQLLSEVERVYDRVAIVRDGRLIMVERLDELKDRFGKVLHVTFESDVPRSALEGLGATDLRQEGRSFIMTVRGEIDEVVKAVAAHHVVSLTMETYHLEQLFFDLYNGGGHDGASPSQGARTEGGEKR